MRARALVPAAAILAIGGALFAWFGKLETGSAAGGRLQVDPVFDFGRALGAEVLTHQFPLKNISKSPLRISIGTPSCGCTTAGAEKLELAPGEATTISVDLELFAKAGTVHAEVPIAVTSGDAVAETFSLRLMAYADTTTGVQPQVIALGEARRGRGLVRKEARLVLPGREATVSTIAWQGAHPGLTLSVGNPDLKNGSATEYVLAATLAPNESAVAAGSYSAYAHVIVKLDGVEHRLQLPVTALVTEQIKATPSALMWQGRDRNLKVLAITSADDSPVAIEGWEMDRTDVVEVQVSRDASESPQVTVRPILEKDVTAPQRVRVTLKVRETATPLEVKTVHVPLLIMP